MLIIILIITIVVVVIVTGIAEPIFKTKKAIKLIRVGDVRTVINLDQHVIRVRCRNMLCRVIKLENNFAKKVWENKQNIMTT